MNNATILIVEDSQIQAEILRRFLTSHGYTCIIATDGEAGLIALRAKHPDLVVSDIQMPILDGYQMCERIKQDPSLQSTPVILLTVLSDPTDVIKGLNAGAEAYLTKPYDNDSLKYQIDRLLRAPRDSSFRPDESVALDVEVNGAVYPVKASREKILQMLISTYENAVQQNAHLLKLEDDLNNLNRQLETKVEERTASLLQEQKRALEAESRYKTLFSLLPEGVGLFDVSSQTFIEFNDILCGQLGYLRDEFLSITLADICQPNDLATIVENFNQAVKHSEYNFTAEMRTRDGGVADIEVRARLIDLHERQYLNCVLRDVSEINRSRKIERELEHKGTHDSLTDLPGKALLLDAITQSIHTAQRTGASVTLVAIELSRLNKFAVSLGHEVSDFVQIELAQRLRELQPKSHMVARVRNQDFIYLMDGSEDASSVPELLTRLLRATNSPFNWHGTELQLDSYMGVGTYPKDAEDAASLLQSTEGALYKAKEEGRMGVVLASVELNEEVQNLVKKESKLRAAVLNNEFEVFYQPRVNLATGKIAGAEALIRWKDPELGIIMPGDFVPLAVEIGVIVHMTDWLLDQVCLQQKKWLDAGVKAVPVSVNLVAENFTNEKIISVIKNSLTVNNLNPHFLEVELTESAAMTNVVQTIDLLNQIREMGVLVAIDDFGTGYSSLSYLEKFPIDILKIDISFIREILTNPHAVVITSVIVAMAKEFGFLIVAEGVEQAKQREFLLELKCDEGQGYLFSKAIPTLEFEQLLKDDQTY